MIPHRGCVSFATLRTAIREESKLRLTYRDAQQVETVRVVWPIVIVYHIECVLLVGWCDLRAAFRHFRTDRIYGCQLLEAAFVGQSKTLRMLWSEQNRWDEIS